MIRFPITPSACNVQRARPAVFRALHAVQSPSCARYTRAAAVAKEATEKPLDLKKLSKLVADACELEVTDVELVTQVVLDTIVKEVASGQKIQLRGFGTFKRVQTAAREGRNPATGAPLQIAASARASFTAAKSFKDSVKEAYKAEKGGK